MYVEINVTLKQKIFECARFIKHFSLFLQERKVATIFLCNQMMLTGVPDRQDVLNQASTVYTRVQVERVL